MAFKRLDPEDFVVSSDSITGPVWSTGYYTLYPFYTGSANTPAPNPYYMTVYHDPNVIEEPQFSIAYGDEVAFVKEQDPNKIWMYGSGDDGGTYIWNGWGFVNRLGYFITEVPFPDNTIIQVQVAEPDLTCDDCNETIDEDEEHQCEEN